MLSLKCNPLVSVRTLTFLLGLHRDLAKQLAPTGWLGDVFDLAIAKRSLLRVRLSQVIALRYAVEQVSTAYGMCLIDEVEEGAHKSIGACHVESVLFRIYQGVMHALVSPKRRYAKIQSMVASALEAAEGALVQIVRMPWSPGCPRAASSLICSSVDCSHAKLWIDTKEVCRQLDYSSIAPGGKDRGIGPEVWRLGQYRYATKKTEQYDVFEQTLARMDLKPRERADDFLFLQSEIDEFVAERRTQRATILAEFACGIQGAIGFVFSKYKQEGGSREEWRERLQGLIDNRDGFATEVPLAATQKTAQKNKANMKGGFTRDTVPDGPPESAFDF